VKPPLHLPSLSSYNETSCFIILERRKSDRPRAEQRSLPLIAVSSVSEWQRQRAERPRKEAADRKQREGRVQQQARLLPSERRGGAAAAATGRGPRATERPGKRAKANVPSEAQGGTLTISAQTLDLH